MTPAPIVAISGPPGSGKTSLTRALQRQLGVPSVHYDDFEPAGRTPAPVPDWAAPGANYDEIPLESLARRIEQLAAMTVRPRCVLFDTPLGRAHRRTGAAIHTLVWIDMPPDVALARRMAAAAGLAKADPAQAVSFAAWLENYLGHYIGGGVEGHRAQHQRVRPAADIILDGRMPLEALAAEAKTALARRFDWEGEPEQPDGPPIGPEGRAMLTLIEDLDCPFGLERSVKLGPDGINEDRFLAIVHKNTLGSDAAATLTRIALALGLPGPMLEVMRGQLDAARIVGFAYEGGAGTVYKIYLEFPEPIRRGLTPGASPKTETVFLAVKWRAGDPGSAGMSRYVWPAEGRGLAAITARLAGFASSAEGLASARAAQDIVAAANGRCPPERILFLEVEEKDSPRYSFDLNLYAAGLPVAAVARPLRQLAAAYGLASAQVETFLQRVGPLQLGHLSGGVSRNGRDFATLYFGATARHGTGRG